MQDCCQGREVLLLATTRQNTPSCHHSALNSTSLPPCFPQLANLCRTAAKVNPALLLATVLDGLFTNITANQVYIGIWGNSNYTSLQEWVQVRAQGRACEMGWRPKVFTSFTLSTPACHTCWPHL